MSPRHRRTDDEPTVRKKFKALLDGRRADVVVSIGCVIIAAPFGVIAVAVVVVMVLLAWFL